MTIHTNFFLNINKFGVRAYPLRIEWHKYNPQPPSLESGDKRDLPLVLMRMDSLTVSSKLTSWTAVLLSTGFLQVSSPAHAASVGEVAPDFEVRTMDGGTVRLSDFRGRMPVYVVFWNTWCTYCAKKTPRYEKLQEQFAGKIKIVAINTTWSDTPDQVREFKKHFSVDYTTVFDSGEVVTDRYDVHKVPTEFIVDRKGVIRYRDGVPEYLVAHLPDLQDPYRPTKPSAPRLVCTR